ncbi:unnamed protein product [Ascophyllum nodosum]
MIPSTRRSYKPHVQPRVESNLHNTLPHVKRSGCGIPGQAYDYHIGRYSIRARAGPPARRHSRWTPEKCPRNLPRLVTFESPHIPSHSRVTDKRYREIGKTRRLRGEQTSRFQRSTTSPGKAPSKQGQRPTKKQTTK